MADIDNIINDDDLDYRYEDDDFIPCNDCDLPDACADYGCAITCGIRKYPLLFK
jgi:hypothetical protein